MRHAATEVDIAAGAEAPAAPHPQSGHGRPNARGYARPGQACLGGDPHVGPEAHHRLHAHTRGHGHAGGQPHGGGHARVDDQVAAQAAHLALFYATDRAYVDGVMSFLQPGLEAGDPVAVAVPPARAGLLRDHLGPSGADFELLDMHELGRNPARIIPAVLTMLERYGGRMLHYVGEPVWPGRSPEEIQEATRHEALINLAWPGASIRVLCPYDAGALDAKVLADAQHTHPWVVRDGAVVRSDAFGGSSFPAGTDNPLPDPPSDAFILTFGMADLAPLRALVSARAAAAGVSPESADDLVIAVNEVATNAIKYGQAGGLLRVWSTGSELICQLEDHGQLTDPLVGRHRPLAGTEGGIGLWMVNQLCDLVEVRATDLGTTLRLHWRVR